MIPASKSEWQLGRLLAALGRPGARLARPANPEGRAEVEVPHSDAPIFSADDAIVASAISLGLVAGAEGEGWAVTTAGHAFLRRMSATSEPFRRQHLDIASAALAESATGRVDVVENESPLAWLHRRRTADGQPLISVIQFAAGERLRADYTRAGLMPRLGVDLSRGPMPKGQSALGNRVADTVDAAIAARERVNYAIGFVGPRLGSLLIDVCCELVGLEEAERQRGWPRRSGKVVLSIALDRLAEHYGLEEAASGPEASGRIRRWGTPDYRPAVGD